MKTCLFCTEKATHDAYCEYHYHTHQQWLTWITYKNEKSEHP